MKLFPERHWQAVAARPACGRALELRCERSSAGMAERLYPRSAARCVAIWLYAGNSLLIVAVAFELLALTVVQAGDHRRVRLTSPWALTLSSLIAIHFSVRGMTSGISTPCRGARLTGTNEAAILQVRGAGGEFAHQS